MLYKVEVEHWSTGYVLIEAESWLEAEERAVEESRRGNVTWDCTEPRVMGLRKAD